MNAPYKTLLTIDAETRWSSAEYTLSKLTTEEYIRDKRFKAFGFCIHEFGSSEPTQWFNHDPPDVMIGYKTPDGKGHNWIEGHNGDPEAATRLAITRAAAEVGRAME